MDNAPDPKDNTNCTETSQLLEAGMMSLGTLPAPFNLVRDHSPWDGSFLFS